jgi:mRNA interferase RelE/StbE
VPYRISWRPRAREHFLALDKPVRKRVDEALDKLAGDPRPAGATPLTGMPGVLRIRVGDYRILYAVEADDQLIRVIEVRHRSKAYGGH